MHASCMLHYNYSYIRAYISNVHIYKCVTLRSYTMQAITGRVAQSCLLKLTLEWLIVRILITTYVTILIKSLTKLVVHSNCKIRIHYNMTRCNLCLHTCPIVAGLATIIYLCIWLSLWFLIQRIWMRYFVQCTWLLHTVMVITVMLLHTYNMFMQYT